MRRAMSFDSQTVSSSEMRSLSTTMRISRPAWSANAFETPCERVGDALELLEPLDVRLEDVAARARPRRRDRVGGLDDHRFERRPVDVHVMRRDGLQHRLALAVLAQEVEAELEVRALQVAIDRLADVVQERGARGDVAVEAELLGHDAGEERDLARVVQDVLAVAGAELQPSHQAQHFGVQIVEAELEGGGLAFLAGRSPPSPP